MSITEIGREAEIKARVLLKKKGYEIFQSDWLGKKNGSWVNFEVKEKEMFKSPPFDGHGMDLYQVSKRMQFERETGIKCLFIVFDKDNGKIFHQWLSHLEKQCHFTTRNNIRVYDLSDFDSIKYF